MKKAFSLGEMLITLFVIGMISALTIPIVTQSIISSYKPVFKSAFQSVEQVVNELINDISVYPSGEFSNNTFCENFFSKTNTIGEIYCSNTFDSVIPTEPNASTTNGMKWYNMDNDFEEDQCPTGTTGECVKISVDINGSNGRNSTTGTDKDVFDIYIFKTGKITVEPGSVEAGYLLD
ncbi:MAG TPA: hypothetical protein P5556_07705 [Candidatus Gastranaerophilales bacterium]|nr:hypothetical protein [Candidatus Gastranaerophilales bacterium]